MKTRTSLFFKGLVAAMLAVIFASCGNSGQPSAEQVAAAISNGKELNQKDYATMIDYCGQYADEAQKYFNDLQAQPNDSTAESIAATNKLADLYAKYQYLDQFRECIANLDLNQLDSENQNKINEYAKYEGFPLPGGEVQKLMNPNVVGDIEQTPSNDSSQVVSSGDGEAVNVNVAD